MAECSINGWNANRFFLLVKWQLCEVSLGSVHLALLSKVADAAYPIPVTLNPVNDARHGQIEKIKRPGQSRLERPDIEPLRIKNAKPFAKVRSNSVLHAQVVLEFIVILDDLVSPPLQPMDKRTGSFALMSLALSVGQKICAVLARAKRALQSVSMAHL